MLKSHEQFHSSNGKRLILIADDELINREMLGNMLKNDYEIIYAENGAETIEQMRAHHDTLSLVLLDIMMPVKTGLEVLEETRADDALSHIPVIMMTASVDTTTEIESLNLGAIDFIPKPYPTNGVLEARILRTIELYEDREIIQSTERDELTGLYNKEYFYSYAEQFDQFHRDREMDAIIVDIDHFHMINERYGKAYGDEVLRRIGKQMQTLAHSQDGFVCRREADTFMAYVPHREDYAQIMENATANMTAEEQSENRVRLRMGVYFNVDKSLDIERRFDRAKMAADTVRGSFTRTIGYYDDNLHKQQLYAEQLIEDFATAIEQDQFQVYYQPKFDVRPNTPILASAEALVRWIHPDLGLVNPGVFVPLFENNGLIQQMDQYVWRETARQIRQWKDELGYAIPISVNVSRIDMYDPKLPETLTEIVHEYGLTGQDLLLEVTESAYTQDSEQIIKMVENLRDLGFMIEMDDFGTGYSSLNMISNLPIDALKLDMQFVRDAFKEGGNTNMVEVIIGISDYLSVPVIAEGVETEDQLHTLRDLGCELVQGYFFSKPVPAEEFEPFILQKKEADQAAFEKAKEPVTGEENTDGPLLKGSELHADKLSELFEKHHGKDNEEPEPEKDPETKVHSAMQLRTASVFFVVIALVAAVALLISDVSVARGSDRMKKASDRYIAAQIAASDMESGSDYLTDRVRCFVVTGDVQYLDDFFEEVEVTRRRDKAVENLETLLEGTDDTATKSLNTALSLSNELVKTEEYSMALMLATGKYDNSEISDRITSVELDPKDLALSPEEMKEKAETLVFDSNYMHSKERIRENVGICTQELIRSSSLELEEASARLSLLVNVQTAMSVFFFLIVLANVLVVTFMVRKPLTMMVEKMQKQESITPTGMEELRFVTRTYNDILKENKEARAQLSKKASHDALTGLFNRGAYDLLMQSTDTKHMALILIDVDYFKSINDNYGHAIGDRVLQRVAEIMRESFRSVDILCRIGGDEFAVVMTRVNSSMSNLVVNKIKKANDLLQHPKDDLPPVSLSVGVAFSDRKNPQGDIFTDADSALYKVKEAGRAGCQVY